MSVLIAGGLVLTAAVLRLIGAVMVDPTNQEGPIAEGPSKL
jgi:hypothetical protein